MTPSCTRRTLMAQGAALAVPGCALTPLPTWDEAEPVVLAGARQIDLAGNNPHDPVRRVMVALPPAPAPEGGWPVLYVLDGNLLFALAAQLMRNRYARGSAVPVSGAVVVGLGYAGEQVLDLDARTWDYTPSVPGAEVDARGRRQGGADAFLDFIATRVRPWVQQIAPVDPARQTLMGHSYGGLCALYALFTRPAMFQNYVVASPSVWWHDGYILQEQARFVAARAGGAPPLQVLVTHGAREGEPPADAARAALVHGRRNAERLQALLQGLRDVPALHLRQAVLPGANHGTSMAPAVQQALALVVEGGA